MARMLGIDHVSWGDHGEYLGKIMEISWELPPIDFLVSENVYENIHGNRRWDFL